MKEHKYILEPYKGKKTRYSCPKCEEKRRFVRYIDKDTGNHLSEKVGRCDREDSCGYHYTPSSFFSDNPSLVTVTSPECNTDVTPVTVCYRPVQHLPFELMNKSIIGANKCNLYPFLEKLFTQATAVQLCKDFFIGRNKEGNTVFWQVDIEGNVRQAKVIEYNSRTGKRNKETGAFFAGKRILDDTEANLQQCFFGEYQIRDDSNKLKTVAIVESEKTAAIASIYFPQFIWIATGGKYGCKWTEQSVCKVLKGRNVILFPDLNAYSDWKRKGELLSAVAECKVVVSQLIEKRATEEQRKAGLDIADFLLDKTDSTGLAITDFEYPIIWDHKD
jgi:hypothetical protein